MRRRPATLGLLIALAALACEDAPAPGDAGIDGGADAGIDAGPRCTPATGLPSPLVCNGHASLCDRTFDAVAYATTHNAMSNEEDRWRPANQGRSMWHQLEDGVRAMMIDTWEGEDGSSLLCHGVCGGVFGQRPLVDGLRDLREFMECRPAEVITLIVEAHLSEDATARAFEEAGLLPYLHEQPEGAPWPTLRVMIESGRRMVVLTETTDRTLPWYHHAYDYAWDNPYAARMPSDLSCEVGRGSRTSALFVLNHFLTAPVAMRSLADMVNYDPELTEHVERCRTETGDFPNFVTVDFYDASDLFAVVDALNGV